MGYPVFASGDILTAADMNAVGLWKITTGTVATTGGTATSSNGLFTFSGSTNLRINSVFSADYVNYLILAQVWGSATSFARWRLRTGNTDSDTNVYTQAGLTTTSVAAGLTAYNQNAQAQWQPFAEYGTSEANGCVSQIIVQRPFQALRTGASAVVNNLDSAGVYNLSHVHTPATSYDGFTVIPNTGSVSGTIRVYGYRN